MVTLNKPTNSVIGKIFGTYDSSNMSYIRESLELHSAADIAQRHSN